MRLKLLIIVLLILVLGGCFYFWPKKVISPLVNVVFTEHGLDKYDFDNLSKRQGIASEIRILGPIKAVEDRRKALKIDNLKFLTREISFESGGKKISGMINYFDDNKIRPAIIMIRGYAEKAGYYPGSGTWKVADELAKEGYVTVSLDFLGYADSDPDSADVLEARFHKVIEVLDLIESVKQLSGVDKDKIGIWAHSNGGQITLSVLEISGQKYPTALWAPMTNPFPQSLIDTADEGEEKEKATKFVSLFTKYYDPRRYAFENYYEWINAPILVQQGTNDSQVKVEWQEKVVDNLKKLDKKAELAIYEGADHNMNGKWQEAVGKDLLFFKELL